MNNYNGLIEYLNFYSINYETNVSFKVLTSFKTGGISSVVVYPKTEYEFCNSIKYLNQIDVKYYILGKGSNVLAPDADYDGVILSTEKYNNFNLCDNIIECESGASLLSLCLFAKDSNLSGLEFAFGIPGTVGGATFMNAGAFGGEMKDVILEVEHIDYDGNVHKLSNKELDFGYRHSFYTDNNYFISKIRIKLFPAKNELISQLMNSYMQKRKEKQPLEYPSAGSTFKRPNGYFAGALIEENNLKGYTVGGAKVSEKHAGFVINFDNATGNDILAVVKHCQEIIKKNNNVILEPEIRIIK